MVQSSSRVDAKLLVGPDPNKRSADPLLVACTLDGQSRDDAYLDAPEWVVDTADDTVRRKAEEFGLSSLSNTESATIIDASLLPNAPGRFDDAPAELEQA